MLTTWNTNFAHLELHSLSFRILFSFFYVFILFHCIQSALLYIQDRLCYTTQQTNSGSRIKVYFLPMSQFEAGWGLFEQVSSKIQLSSCDAALITMWFLRYPWKEMIIQVVLWPDLNVICCTFAHIAITWPLPPCKGTPEIWFSYVPRKRKWNWWISSKSDHIYLVLFPKIWILFYLI